MIATIRGKLARKAPESVIIENHGIGYEVFISLNTFYKLPGQGEELSLLTYTHVREDCLQLYGFLDDGEKKLFHLLLGVSKIGARLALNILSGITPAELKEAILSGDQFRLSQIPRVGRKTADRIIVELRDRVKDVPTYSGVTISVDANLRMKVDDALEALLILGYSKKDAELALNKVLADIKSSPETRSVEELLKKSLALLTHG